MGNTKLDALASILIEQAKNNIGTVNAQTTPNNTETDAYYATGDISHTAEVVASVIADKAQKL